MPFAPDTVWKKEKNAGLVVGNAALAADVSPSGRMFQRILVNPPCFEEGKNGIAPAGESGWFFTVDGETLPDAALEWEVLERDYPRFRDRAALPGGITVERTAFAPIAVNDTEPMFLPAILMSLRFSGDLAAHRVTAAFLWLLPDALCGEALPSAPAFRALEHCAVAERGCAFVGMCGGDDPHTAGGGTLGLAASLPAVCGDAELRCWFGVLTPEHRFRAHADSAAELSETVSRDFESLAALLEEWIACVPNTGDEQILRYTRWYMQAAVMLTKADAAGRVITMGYRELNQRDSFWTSYLHLAFWPALEQTMIRESCLWQRPNGKIPTTIYPKYERQRDIDINEYFCLRIGRYYRYHRDLPFLRFCWPYFERAVCFLHSMDRDGDGLPEQAPPEDPLCFWADWKDVKGVIGRKLAPHFVLLWLAVLKEGAFLANALGDKEAAARYEADFARAEHQANLPVEAGGLWQNDHYAEVWYDGRNAPELLIDQTVGMAFGVVPKDRAERIRKALERGEQAAGIPETYPFREEMEYAPGEYHNGGIWPFLVFCDCLGRYLDGDAKDAERLIRKIGLWDLEKPGDWAPNEYLNGRTMENRGFEVQGWSSALFGALTHGAFPFSWEGNGLRLEVCVPDRDFCTKLVLPQPFGVTEIGRKNGVLYYNAPPGLRLTLCEGPAAQRG